MLSQERVQALCTPHFPALYRLPMRAWDKYHGLLPTELLVAFHRRTRACGVHDLMALEAAKYAAEAEDVEFFDVNGMRGLIIADTLAIRMKKMDEDSLSRSQVTNQVQAFRDQIALAGCPTTHNLEIGYVLNEAETSVAEIRLVSPSGCGIGWCMRLEDGDPIPVVTGFVLPAPDAPGLNIVPAKIEPKETGTVLPFRKANEDED